MSNQPPQGQFDDGDDTGPIPPVERTGELPRVTHREHHSAPLPVQHAPGQGQDTPQQAPAHQQPGPHATGPQPAPQQDAPFPGSGPQQGGHNPWAAPAPYSSNVQAAPRRKRRSGAPWIAVPLAAILAAGLASGTTYALTSQDAPSSSSTTRVVTADPADYQGSAETVNWSGTAKKVTPSVVSITVESGSSGGEGSGVVLDDKGHIVTNNHVVDSADGGGKITVTLSNNLSYQAKVVGTDPSTDLAVIKLEKPPSDLTPITLGDDAALVVGQPVMAVGNPLGYSSTVTTGIISALNRPVTAGNSRGSSDSATVNAVQTSAPINPGNSGGALVSASGQLVGINSSIATLGSRGGQSGNIGIGFAIPVSVVKSISDQLIKNGKVQHAQLGVQVATGAVKIGDASETAAIIRSVNSGSAAADAGLKENDAVVSADGRPVVSSDALVGYVRAKTVGDVVELEIIRDGKKQKVEVTLKEAD